MGATASAIQVLATDPQLLHLVSKTHVLASDRQAWDRVLKAPFDGAGYVCEQLVVDVLV